MKKFISGVIVGLTLSALASGAASTLEARVARLERAVAQIHQPDRYLPSVTIDLDSQQRYHRWSTAIGPADTICGEIPRHQYPSDTTWAEADK